MEVVFSKVKKTKFNSLWDQFLPIPWKIWPAEGRLLLVLFLFWSVAGLFLMGSASWWVASREMGDGAYYIKRQVIWMIAVFMSHSSYNPTSSNKKSNKHRSKWALDR